MACPRTASPALTLALVMGLGMCSAAAAQSVALAGMLGRQALLVVDGSAPKSVAVGQSHLNVKVISTAGDQAVLELGGKRITLRVGDSPVSVGAMPTGSSAAGSRSQILISASSGGHFMTQGQINGRAVQFMVDTGATSIAMSAAVAERTGLNYKNGQPIRMSTANGIVQGYKLRLDSVRIGDVEVYGVDAVVTPESMPFVLLGNSFLTRFQMRRENDLLTLDKRF